jgi:protocatechuate 3,4-dioxygenase beta subunit
MRIRRAIVGLAMSVVASVTPDRAAALSCVPTTLLQDVLAAGGVFEATIIERRPVAQPLPPGLPAGVPPPPIIGADTFELSLDDVVSLRGASATTIRTSFDYLRPGQRYVFVAFSRGNGGLGIGGCGGRAFDASRVAGLKAWIASLAAPATGGHLFGAVFVPATSPGIDAETPIAGARVTARGPIVVEEVTDAQGQFAFTGLPDGKYEVSVVPGAPSGSVTIARTTAALLIGDHAAASADLFASVTGAVSGRVVDEAGRPVANKTLRLTVALSAGDPERSAYWLATTDADGRYTASDVRPGRYLLTLGTPFAYVHGATLSGDTEVAVGWAEHVEMQPIVARMAETIRVEGTLLDASGQPVEGGVYVEAIGPHGPYPMSGSAEDTASDGRFRLRLLRGVRYRLTAIGTDGARVTVDQVADGTPIRIALPRLGQCRLGRPAVRTAAAAARASRSSKLEKTTGLGEARRTTSR